MTFHLNPAYGRLQRFIEELPRRFDSEGRTLHAGRNTLKAFEIDGTRIAVKRYQRAGGFDSPSPWHGSNSAKAE